MFDIELHIANLIAASLQGRITDTEQVQLDAWLIQNPENQQHFETAYQEYILKENLRVYNSADKESIWLKTTVKINADKNKTSEIPVRKLYPFRRINIAAAVVLVLFGIYFFNYRNGKHSGSEALVTQHIEPGSVGATLALANGKKIRLNEAANGELAKEAGVVITKSANGDLIYEIKDKAGESGKVNTLSTANGQTYHLRLPDGTLVWLNSASSLTYAANLIKNGHRKVKLKGEAYFEVAKDKAHPFVVESKGQEVEVLGTHFNINSYADEPSTKTTLLEGSVRIVHAPSSGNAAAGSKEDVILKPNQQADLQRGIIKVKPVVAEDAIAWKNGYFNFDSDNLESIMGRIARWYNIQPVYEDEFLKQEIFIGTISKYEKISKVLHMMERTGSIAFEIKGNKVIIKRNK
jgi:transmembrane sensor